MAQALTLHGTSGKVEAACFPVYSSVRQFTQRAFKPCTKSAELLSLGWCRNAMPCYPYALDWVFEHYSCSCKVALLLTCLLDSFLD